ncbi:hypothetical protein [Bacillus altitudinis]
MSGKTIVEMGEIVFELGLLALTSNNLNQFMLQTSVAFFIRFGFGYLKKED